MSKELETLRKIILISQGKCKVKLPYLRCPKGHFPNCKDGKAPIVVKPHLWCRE